jgi:hypothetical protein
VGACTPDEAAPSDRRNPRLVVQDKLVDPSFRKIVAGSAQFLNVSEFKLEQANERAIRTAIGKKLDLHLFPTPSFAAETDSNF